MRTEAQQCHSALHRARVLQQPAEGRYFHHIFPAEIPVALCMWEAEPHTLPGGQEMCGSAASSSLHALMPPFRAAAGHLPPLDLPLFGEHAMVFPSYPSLEGQTGFASQSTAPCPLQKPRETTEEKITAARTRQLSLPNLPLPLGSAVPLRNVRDQSSRWEGGRGLPTRPS